MAFVTLLIEGKNKMKKDVKRGIFYVSTTIQGFIIIVVLLLSVPHHWMKNKLKVCNTKQILKVLIMIQQPFVKVCVKCTICFAQKFGCWCALNFTILVLPTGKTSQIRGNIDNKCSINTHMALWYFMYIR